MNKVFIVGRLARDPELRYPSNSQNAVASIVVAVNRPFENSQGERVADFINVTVWRKQAENVKKYLSKGSLVGVDGRIQISSFDGADGKRVYRTDVVAESVQFLESRSASQNRTNNTFAPQTESSFNNFPSNEPSFNTNQEVNNTTSVEEDPFSNFSSELEISDDDLPF